MRTLFVIFIILFGFKANAQIVVNCVKSDARIDKIIEEHIKISKIKKKINGYRIQIFFESGANSKQKAISKQNGFSNLYPELKAYLSFKEPYYRVRIGNFKTLMEAEAYLLKIKENYPNAFVTNDIIDLETNN